MIARIIIATLSLMLASCTAFKSSPPPAKFQKTSFRNIEGWQHDEHKWAFASFKNSCEKIILIEDDERDIAKSTQNGGTAIDWQVPCFEAELLESPSNEDARKFFERWFEPYKVLDDNFNETGTITGYYQIELYGSKKKDKKYKYPVHRRPSNLEEVKGTSDIDHSSIIDGALEGKNLEIAWVDNRARLYLMHIQGSGVIKLREGGEYFLRFDGHNGYKFKGISEALKDRDMQFQSYQEMIDWLHRNPKDCNQILAQDPSYVFFRDTDKSAAAGGQGVPLHPERSIAIDSSFYPYGAPIWVESNLNESRFIPNRKYNRLLIAQDAGGAIKGPIRGDVFFGRGQIAENVAMSFKTPAKFYVLFPKTVSIK